MTDLLTGKAIQKGSKLLPEVYKDLAQPGMRAVGTTLGRAIHSALAPVRGVIWSAEQAEDWLKRAVEERFAKRGVPEERVVTPPPLLINGVIRGVQAASATADSTLRESFANLLATAMDADRSSMAHPAFADVLSQVTPDEARAIEALARQSVIPLFWRLSIRVAEGTMARYQHRLTLAEELGWEPRNLSMPYISNLTRLGIVKPGISVLARESDVLGVGYRDAITHWSIASESFYRHGSKPVVEAISHFEILCKTSRPGVQTALIASRVTPTPFGAQMLRAIMDPVEYAEAPFVKIAQFETDSEVLKLK